MISIEPKIVEHTVAILGTNAISEEEIETQVAAIAASPMEARRLIDWIPEAFGYVLIGHLGKNVILPSTFSARYEQGEWESFPLTSEPIFALALEIAQTAYHQEPRALFTQIATRSAAFNSANNLLHGGGFIEGAAFSGPALIGIPAEIYPNPRPPGWRKLLPFWRKVLGWYFRYFKKSHRTA